MNPQKEIKTLQECMDDQYLEMDRIRQRLNNLQSRIDEAQEKISCPICNEPAPDGLEACSACYGKHYVSTCRINRALSMLSRTIYGGETGRLAATIATILRGEDKNDRQEIQ